jgi:hypothetical protein
VVVTAADAAYYEAVLTLLRTIDQYNHSTLDAVFVWDVGFTWRQRALLRATRAAELRDFPPSRLWPYEDWLAGPLHAFKTMAIQGSGFPGDSVLWVDAGVAISGSLDNVFDCIERDGIFLTQCYQHRNREWTNAACAAVMEANAADLDAPQVQSGLVGFRIGGRWQGLLDDWAAWATVRSAHAGSPTDHRWDQSTLSILAHRWDAPLLPGGAFDRYAGSFEQARLDDVPFYVHRRTMPTAAMKFVAHRIFRRIVPPSSGSPRSLQE